MLDFIKFFIYAFYFFTLLSLNLLSARSKETLFDFLKEESWVKKKTSYDVTSDKIGLRVAPE